MAWTYLIIAGLFEIGWPVGLKIAQDASTRITGICIAVVFMGVSGLLLWLAQKQIPMGHPTQYGQGLELLARFWLVYFSMETQLVWVDTLE